MKITYIICSLLMELIYLAVMLLSPIYLTPGYYFWSVLAFIFLISSGEEFSSRMDTWK